MVKLTTEQKQKIRNARKILSYFTDIEYKPYRDIDELTGENKTYIQYLTEVENIVSEVKEELLN